MEDTMQMQKKLSILVLILSLVLAACAGTVGETANSQAAGTSPTQAVMGGDGAAQAMDETPESMPNKTSEPGMGEAHQEMNDSSAPEDPLQDQVQAADAETGSMDRPDFFAAQLVQPSSGEVYTINDYQGKVVLVETLAMWCSNCLQQQKQVKALHNILGERDDFVSIGLDIDPNEEIDMLKAYTAQHGFDWMYAIAPREVAREIAQRYGDQFLNPPSTPMFIIDRHGEVHPLPFGIKDSITLKDYLEPFLNSDM
jgi:cytochrome oxidase Cu insertion factor (SCO1/SenC/PrrC family)